MEAPVFFTFPGADALFFVEAAVSAAASWSRLTDISRWKKGLSLLVFGLDSLKRNRGRMEKGRSL